MIRPKSEEDYLKGVRETFAHIHDAAQLNDTIVNAPFGDNLGAIDIDLGVVVLLLARPETKTIDRIALSDTYSAKGAVRMS